MPSRRKTRARSNAMMSSVIEATLQLLGQGTATPSIRQIAKRAGVGLGSIYDYFEGRDAIFSEVFQRVTKDNFDALERAWDGSANESIEASVSRLTDELFDLYLDRPALTRTTIRVLVGLGQLRFVTAERDRFCELLLREPRFGFEQTEETANAIITVVDMMMGVIVSELYRPEDRQRLQSAKEACLRMALRELERVRSKATNGASRTS